MTPEQWLRVQELFQAALEQPAASREAWLMAQDAEPAVLTDVRALLRADASDAHERIAGVIATTADALRDVIDRAPVAGTRLGPYRLLEELGHGGMGTVYLAERADDQYRARVAIKVVRGQLATPDLSRRLLLERQILADLTHPNIAWLIDGGSTDDGTPYLVMEYIDGQPIDAWCDTTDLGLSGRIALFRTVCEAVRFAHAGLVVHRDIKPSNILVGRDGVPKLVDFGIAKLLAGEGATDATGTMRFLTPAYAAPEQLRGDRITVATDVYALGGVLYRLLTGKPPLDTTGLSAAELEQRITEVMPQMPSVVARSSALPWARRLEGDLDTIILTALHKDPARRYPSVERLVDDLHRHAAGLPVLARPDTMRYRASKFVRRHRTGVVVATTALCTLALLLSWHTVRITAERNRAQLEAARATAVAAFLRGLFEVSDPENAQGETITARELLDAGAARITTELQDQPSVQATLMRTIGEVYSSLGMREQAGPLIERAYAQHLALHGPTHEETATSRLVRAVWLQDIGRVAEAEPEFRAALEARTTLYGASDPAVGDVHRTLAYTLEANGNYAEAEPHFRAAVTITRNTEPLDRERLAESLARLGRFLRGQDRFAEAEPLLREALTMQRSILGPTHPDVASSARNLASMLRDLQQYEAADTLYLESLALRRQIFGEQSLEVANTLNSYGNMLESWGNRDSALSVTHRALRILETVHQQPHNDLGAVYSNMGVMLHRAGRGDEAIEHYIRSLEILDVVAPADHPNRAFPLLLMAAVYAERGDYQRAEPLQRQALALRRAGLPAGHRHLAEAAGDLGETLAATNRRQEAEPLLEEAHRILEEGLGPDDGRTQRALQRLEEFRNGG